MVVELCDLILFADDSKAVGPARKHNRIQIDLSDIGSWSERTHLPLCIRYVLTNMLHFIKVCTTQ